MDFPWQVPLAQQEYTTSRVVVYFYSGGWIPITFYPLIDAIRLHRLALSSGMDIVVFPPDMDPRNVGTSFTETGLPIVSPSRGAEALTGQSSQYATTSTGKSTDAKGIVIHN